MTAAGTFAPTALIVVAREAEEQPAGLIALLPVAGRPLVEHQALRARDAGAGALLLVARTLSAELTRVAERLRGQGLPTRIALTAADAAARASDEPLLLIADGFLPDDAALRTVIAADRPTLLVGPDTPDRADWERIDATTRWAGLALLSADALANAAAMPEDWDLELVLVRPLAGAAARIDGMPLRIARAGDARAAEDRLIPDGPMLERAAVRALAERRVGGRTVRVAALAMAWGGATLTAFGPFWAGLPLLIAAGPIDRMGRRLAVARLEPVRHGRQWRHARLGALAVGLALVGARLSGAPGYEPLLLAGVTLLLLVAARNQAQIAHLRPSRWAARPTPMLWLATPLILAGQGIWALVGLAGWSAASLLHLQWRGLKSRRGG